MILGAAGRYIPNLCLAANSILSGWQQQNIHSGMSVTGNGIWRNILHAHCWSLAAAFRACAPASEIFMIFPYSPEDPDSVTSEAAR
jgi:hypothetical protein